MHSKQVRRRRLVLAALVVISLILLTDYFGESPSSPLHTLQRGIVEVFSPIQQGASTVLSPVRDIGNWFSDTFKARSQVKQLKAENQTLRLSWPRPSTPYLRTRSSATWWGLTAARAFRPITPWRAM